jgi:hypothetical protein
MTPAAAASPNPATTHWMAPGVACRSFWAAGIATLTMKKSRVVMKVPVRTTSRVDQRNLASVDAASGDADTDADATAAGLAAAGASGWISIVVMGSTKPPTPRSEAQSEAPAGGAAGGPPLTVGP